MRALKFIEQTIYDLRFEYVAHEEDSTPFFKINDLNKNMKQETLNRLLRQKKDKREDFMIQLSREVASPSNHLAFTLLDIMTMTDLSVSKQALNIIVELYDVRSEFMK